MPRGANDGARSAPLVVVANHVNGLIDPMFLLGPLRLPARMLGKSTLWKIPVLAQILDLAGVIPVYRRQDEGADTSRNLETFARCHEELARGGVVAIFPEGTSHDEPSLQPLRTGAARIVLEAEARLGPLGTRILPVGLLFEERRASARGRWSWSAMRSIRPRRSRSTCGSGHRRSPADRPSLRRARARDPQLLAAGTKRDWSNAARGFSRSTTSSCRSNGGCRRSSRRGAICSLDSPGCVSASRRRSKRRSPRREPTMSSSCASGLRDEQVVASYPVEKIAGFLARQLALGALALPLAAIGTALHLLPYALVHGIARRVRDEPNQVATYKVFPAIAIYPCWWVLLAFTAGWFGGWPAGIAALLFAPLTGGLALRFHDRRERLWREGRAYLLLRGRRELARQLRELRHAADGKIDRLVELWTEAQAYEPDARRT